MKDIAALILAAGKGTRMKSNLPKVLHKLCGKTLVQYVVDSAKEAGIKIILIVVGHKAEMVKKHLGNKFEYVFQKEQLGTGHAVLQAEENLKDFDGHLIVLCGDAPLLQAQTLKTLILKHRNTDAIATVLTAMLDDPYGYGRILRDSNGCVRGIIEENDATLKQKSIKEINSGLYCFNTHKLFTVLKQIKSENIKGEYYLTDVVKILVDRNEKVETLLVKNSQEILGVDTRKRLQQARKILKSL